MSNGKDGKVKRALASVQYLQDNLHKVKEKKDVIQYLKAETLFILRVLGELDDCSDIPDSAQVNWFKYINMDPNSPYVYDAATADATTLKSTFQTILDTNFPPVNTYRIIRFELIPDPLTGPGRGAGKVVPLAYLCPPVKDLGDGRGGPNGDVNPGNPPH